MVTDEKYERAFRVLATELFSMGLKLHVLSNIVEAQLPENAKGTVETSSTNYVLSNGDQALITFFDHLRHMATRQKSTETIPPNTLDALWREFETIRIQYSQEVADHEWRRLWGAL